MSNFLRFFYILLIIRKYNLTDFAENHKSFLLKIFCFFLNFPSIKKKTHSSKEQRLRYALEQLGPLFVKFGQVISTRRDILYEELANELTLLQDQVTPFSGKKAIEIIEISFKKKINEIFSNFSETPVASASIAQVHFGTLVNNKTQVAVKVLRPNIIRKIDKDLKLLYSIANLVRLFIPGSERLKPKEVIKEFDDYLHDEVDLLYEAANASKLKRNFAKSSILKIPDMVWDLCSSNVIVMEQVHGIPINKIEELKKAEIDLIKLSHEGVEIFFTQVFRDGFFHADMHPGNIFVGKDGKYFGKYIALDFGIVGSLTESDKNYLARNFLAFFRRDYRKVAELHIESGWVPLETQVNSLESAIRTVCEPYFDKPLKEISLAQVLLRLFQASKKFNVIIQPQLVLLQKTLLNVEGLGRQLNPNLDLWVTAKPFLENWMSEQIGFNALRKQVITESENWAVDIPKLPRLGIELIKELKNTSNLQKKNQAKILTFYKKAIKWFIFVFLINISLMGFLIILFFLEIYNSA